MNRAKIAGILTIILGIAICSVWFGCFTSVLYDRYLGIAYKDLFDSFVDYLLTNGKLEIVEYIVAVIICILTGVCLIEKSQEHQVSQK